MTSYNNNNHDNINISDTVELPARPVKPIKPKFFHNKLTTIEQQQAKQPNLLKSSLNNSLLKQTNYRSFLNNNKNSSSNHNIDIDNSSMRSMLAVHSGEEEQQLNNRTNPQNESVIYNDSEYLQENRGVVVGGGVDQLENSSPFIFNYNSLMNVSMLDNIQATNQTSNNNNSEIDNMNCSILMFN